MRMRSCPHCGAENSTRRSTCYQCEKPLAPGPPPASESAPRNSAPASRWDAIEVSRTGRGKTRRTSTDSIPTAATPSPPARKTAGRSVPIVRRSVGHVRRMGVFFHELHTLVRSGITITAACRELERRAPAMLRPVARDMAEAAENGRPVSEAMQQYHTLFYPWHLGVIRAAEIGAFLPEAFEQIAHAYEVEWETRTALRLRLFVYSLLGMPAILFSLPLLLTVAQPIPTEGWTPETVIATVIHYFKTVSLPIAAGLVGLSLVWQALQSVAWFQVFQQGLVLRLPIVGRVARAAALDRYLATLGLMLRGGLPIASAAEEAALAAGNPVLTPRLLGFVPELREGVPLSSLLSATRMFNADTLNMAATGEVSGDLPDMLARAAGYYREENEAKRRMLLRVAGITIGVLWIVLMGAITLFGVRVYFDFAFRIYDWMTEGL
jgi:type II secretory pathway component PulF